MAIYLGNDGFVELSRSSAGQSFITEVDPADVNTLADRLNFDFGNSEFMTGDLVEFTRVDANGNVSSSNLDFVDPADFPGGSASNQAQWYVNVDAQNGVRLYSTAALAIENKLSNAAQLQTPGSTYKVRVELKNNEYKCFGQLQSYELNTDREVVDVTVLGEHARKSISSLISGSGSMTAFWDYELVTNSIGTSTEVEVSNYYHQLILRQQQGSKFKGKFMLKRPEVGKTANAVYYETEAIVTGVAVTFDPGDAVRSQIQFITTGEIKLIIGKPTALLNQLINQTGGAYNLQNSAGRLGLSNP